MKILITGGAGFIGSHITDSLIESGNKVVIIDNLSTGLKRNINPKAKFYCFNICDKENIKKVFIKERPDIVSHHSAQVNVRSSIINPMKDIKTNIIGSINILENCIISKVKKIIFASSGGTIYGNKEKSKLPIIESESINPISPYGINKYIIEKYILFYHDNYNLSYTILRYGNVFGERQNIKGEAGVIPLFIKKMIDNKKPLIFGDGKQTRDYIYIKDVVNLHNKVLTKGENKIFNVGCGKEISVNNLFSIIKKNINFAKEPIYKEKNNGEIQFNCLDSSKAKKELNWKCQFNFKDGIKKTIKWYK